MISNPTDVEDIEANYFAMHLLMPTQFLLRDIGDGIDLTDDDAVKKLAERYQVPASIMAIRLQELMSEGSALARAKGNG